MRRYIFLSILLASLFSLMLVVTSISIKSTHADTTYYQVNIATNPAKSILTVSNLAPGDEVSSVLDVQNNGNLDFNYTVSANQENGVIALYNALLIKIFDANGQLYEGRLNQLQDFDLGTIAKSNQTTLTFKAILPKDSDNSLQGETTSVVFVFNATGHNEEIPADDCFEPPFSNRNFTLHEKSTVPIKFHIKDGSGNLITSANNDVHLEVSGPSPNGGTVTYSFRVIDGTIKFDHRIDEPHYLARFSTFDYPVVIDAMYTATVYLGSTSLFSKDFVILEQGNRSNSP